MPRAQLVLPQIWLRAETPAAEVRDAVDTVDGDGEMVFELVHRGTAKTVYHLNLTGALQTRSGWVRLDWERAGYRAEFDEMLRKIAQIARFPKEHTLFYCWGGWIRRTVGSGFGVEVVGGEGGDGGDGGGGRWEIALGWDTRRMQLDHRAGLRSDGASTQKLREERDAGLAKAARKRHEKERKRVGRRAAVDARKAQRESHKLERVRDAERLGAVGMVGGYRAWVKLHPGEPRPAHFAAPAPTVTMEQVRGAAEAGLIREYSLEDFKVWREGYLARMEEIAEKRRSRKRSEGEEAVGG